MNVVITRNRHGLIVVRAGQATRHLMPFRRIIGLDTSETMLSTARTLFSSPTWSEKISFANGSAEDLSSVGVQDGTVDLIISAQACHWFDWSKIWPETRRVLKKGGCAAFWVNVRLDNKRVALTLILDLF